MFTTSMAEQAAAMLVKVTISLNKIVTWSNFSVKIEKGIIYSRLFNTCNNVIGWAAAAAMLVKITISLRQVTISLNRIVTWSNFSVKIDKESIII